MDLSTGQKDDAHSQNDEIKSDGEPNENSDNSQQIHMLAYADHQDNEEENYWYNKEGEDQEQPKSPLIADLSSRKENDDQEENKHCDDGDLSILIYKSDLAAGSQIQGENKLDDKQESKEDLDNVMYFLNYFL